MDRQNRTFSLPKGSSRFSLLNFDKLGLMLGWLLIALIVFFSLMPTPPRVMHFNQSDKFEHLIVYTILMLWFTQIYRRRSHLWLGLGFIVMGVSLEILQGVSVYRTFEYSDMLANSTGVMFGLLLAKTRMVIVWWGLKQG